jgi:hypothetical protein
MPYTGTEYSHQKEAELSMSNERWNDDHDNDVSFFSAKEKKVFGTTHSSKLQERHENRQAVPFSDRNSPIS